MKIRRHLRKVLSARLLYVFMLIGAQCIILFYALSQLAVLKEIQLALNLLSAVLAFRLTNKYENSAYKLSWLIIILLLPLFGVFIYLLFGNKAAGRPLIKWIRKATYKGGIADIPQNNDALAAIESADASAAKTAKYISNTGMMPMHDNCDITFLKTGEEWHEALIAELKKATEFIFLEFFIIEEGVMWQSILDILKQKVKKGVDVRVIYDDVGCVKTLPAKYYKYLNSLGIKCHVFNRLVPALSIRHNNRDHRKICVIDGRAAFTGGVNLADEYINKTIKFGHWHDNGIMMQGRCVDNMTVLFISAWDFLENKEKPEYDNFIKKGTKTKGSAFCQPFTTSPFSNDHIAANVYLHMISRAKDYIYITTPYLIIDFTMEQALITAAQSGIDVKIMLPGIPDKPLLYEMAKSYFERLTKAGVKIYIYTPGFMHAKMCVSDDTKSIVGSINLDYRSLYLHFENACYIYDIKTAKEIKENFNELIKQCRLVTLEDIKKEGFFKKALRAVFFPFAPLL